jgi:hypothetical protein
MAGILRIPSFRWRLLAPVAALLATVAAVLGGGRPATPAEAAPATAPLKLFWHAGVKDNLLCATAQCEQDALVAGYTLVRVEGRVFTTQQATTVPLNLYFHLGRADHLTCVNVASTSPCHRDAHAAGYQLVRTEGWVYSTSQPGTVPLSRFWHTGHHDNATCTSAKCATDQIDAGYQLVGVDGYTRPSEPGDAGYVGWNVRLCRETNYEDCMRFGGSEVTNLGTWDNTASSIMLNHDAIAAGHLPRTYAVSVFELPNFQGRCQTFTDITQSRVDVSTIVSLDPHDSDDPRATVVAKLYPGHNLSKEFIGDNSISSLKFGPSVSCPHTVQVCDGTGLGGACRMIERAVPDLRPFAMNDRISSMRITNRDAPVSLYEHFNYNGRCETFNVPDFFGRNAKDDHDLSNNAIGNNTISSIKVGEVCPVVLWQNPGAGQVFNPGRMLEFGYGDYTTLSARDFSDYASSMVVNALASFYEHPNFEGRCFQVRVGERVLDLRRIGWDNKISSMRIGVGCPVSGGAVLCSAINFAGTCRSFLNQHVPDLRNVATNSGNPAEPVWNNITSSVRATGAPVAVYQLQHYQGRCQTIRPHMEVSDLRTSHIGNDAISSLRTGFECNPHISAQ